jgi:DmsE family decaheme c-type cytochrome
MKPRRAWVVAAGFASVVACGRWIAPSSHARLVRAEAASIAVPDQDCLGCHADQADSLGHGVHRKVLGCQTCHGPGKQHIEEPPGHIVGAQKLRALGPSGQSEMCLDCHGSLLLPWTQGDHAAASLSCASCHADVVHFKVTEAVKPAADFRKQQGFCQQCHALDTLGFRQIFHHPVPEAAMDCTSCHSVHGRLERTVALGTNGPGECARCHRRQAETHVFEHPAMRDGCLACHQAHGSPLRALLTEPGNTLCLKCHLEASFPVIEGVDHSTLLARGGACYDCHVDVHGSNTDPSLLGRLR